jgi:uncharacterized membrane protein
MKISIYDTVWYSAILCGIFGLDGKSLITSIFGALAIFFTAVLCAAWVEKRTSDKKSDIETLQNLSGKKKNE